jgi:hypothetical protein
MTEHFKERASAAVSTAPDDDVHARTVQGNNNNDPRMNVMLKYCKVNRYWSFVAENWASKSIPSYHNHKGAQDNRQSAQKISQRCKQNESTPQILK